jgi:hypothetical protein
VRALLATLHLLLGIGFLVAAATVAGDAWRAPSAVFAGVGASAALLGWALFTRAAWARWLVLPLIVLGSLIALFLLAGSIVLPEQAGLWIVAGYVLFVAFELATFAQLRRADGPGP